MASELRLVTPRKTGPELGMICSLTQPRQVRKQQSRFQAVASLQIQRPRTCSTDHSRSATCIIRGEMGGVIDAKVNNGPRVACEPS